MNKRVKAWRFQMARLDVTKSHGAWIRWIMQAYQGTEQSGLICVPFGQTGFRVSYPGSRPFYGLADPAAMCLFDWIAFVMCSFRRLFLSVVLVQ